MKPSQEREGGGERREEEEQSFSPKGVKAERQKTKAKT